MNALLRLFALAVSVLLALPASAAPRTFVASFGLDTNNCSITAPCRTFAAAMAQTNPSGEVIVLDSAGYGAVTISQSVSIIAPEGVYAGISVLSGTGVSVNPGVAGKVVLRGLSINGQGGGPGIFIFSGEVHVERCAISNMSPAAVSGSGIIIAGGNGVYISDSVIRSNGGNGMTVQGGTPNVFVSDTRVAENGFSGVVHQSGTLTLDRVRSQNHPVNGLAVSPLLEVRALVRDSQFSGSGSGISVFSEAGETADVTVERSAAFLNTTGFLVQTSETGIANLVVRDSVANENGTGIRASGSTGVPTVFVAGSTVTQNTTGFAQTGTTAVFNSLGNNVRRGNGTDASGVITTLALQ